LTTARKRIFLLGSTGSIGRQTLDVIASHPERFEAVGMTAGSDVASLIEQAQRFNCGVLGVGRQEAGDDLRASATAATVGVGLDAIGDLIEQTQPDLVVGAISGIAGLGPVLRSLSLGIDVALANKEPLVAAGELVTTAAARAGVRLLPIDSEISAVFQCLEGRPPEHLHHVILTASGGAFRDYPKDQLAQVTPAMALDHPTWNMGRKITVDSATLANKGFEVFELKWMFDLDFSQIEILVHHQSIIHSMVEFIDGSTLAQLSLPDMRFAIQYALTWPERLPTSYPRLNLADAGPLTFDTPDFDRFPSLRLAFDAGKAGRSYPVVLNAANERAVELFLDEKIGFTQIPEFVEHALEEHEPVDVKSLDVVMAVDAGARQAVSRMVPRR